MKKFTLLSLLAGLMAMPATVMAADGFMEPATLAYPSSLLTSMPPFIVDVTWDNQAIELINPTMDEYGDEVVEVYVSLDDEGPIPANAGILSSLSDDGSDDIWELEIYLYDLDELWDFYGETITITIPEGVVKNKSGLQNPAQDFVFQIVDAYTDYEIYPESGSSLVAPDDAFVYVSFGGNPLTYQGGDVAVRIYFPDYKEYTLKYGQEVFVEDNQVIIDLNNILGEDLEVVIPEGMFTVIADGEELITPDIWLEYTVTGTTSVSSLETENVFAPIYNLNGVKVGNSSSVKTLSPGIYVIDGKKVMIK